MLFASESIGQGYDLVHMHTPPNRIDAASEIPPITDDGDDLSGMLTAEHMLVSFKCTDAPASYHLEVLDEQGKCVLTRNGTSRQGRNFLPLDVTALQQGRYVVRVQYAGATGHSRFLRP